MTEFKKLPKHPRYDHLKVDYDLGNFPSLSSVTHILHLLWKALLASLVGPYYREYEDDTAQLNSALLHSTLGQCEKISDCSYTGQAFLQKRNINNVNQLEQNTAAGEESHLEAGAD